MQNASLKNIQASRTRKLKKSKHKRKHLIIVPWGSKGRGTTNLAAAQVFPRRRFRFIFQALPPSPKVFSMRMQAGRQGAPAMDGDVGPYQSGDLRVYTVAAVCVWCARRTRDSLSMNNAPHRTLGLTVVL